MQQEKAGMCLILRRSHVCSGYVLPPLVHEFTLHQLLKENATSAQVAASDTTTSACVCISAYVCVHI